MGKQRVERNEPNFLATQPRSSSSVEFNGQKTTKERLIR